MKKVIVTGANGFIGRAICRELAKHDIEVIAIVHQLHENDIELKGIPNIRIVYSDLENYRTLPEFVFDRDVDALYHLAWMGSAGPLRGDIDVQLRNIAFTCDTVKACAEIGCNRFVFASSIMEYEIAAMMSTDATPNINTLYCSAKLSADYMARTIAGSLKIDYIRALISNVYGPGEKNSRLVNTSLHKLISGEHCEFSSAEQMYDFIYIDDAAKAFVAIGERGIKNRTYYIGSQKPRPLKDFLIEIRDQVDPNITLGFGEIPFNGVSLKYNEFDIHAVKNDTGFVPITNFSTGIQRTIKWIKESR